MILHIQAQSPRQLKRLTLISFSLLMGLCMVVLVLALLRFEVRADTLCVKPEGGDGCQATISQALDMANEGDLIRVAAGNYTENVFISQTVTLQGGWSPDFLTRDTTTFSSTIHPADNTQSVVSIQGMFANPGAVAPTLDGFVITGGRADLGSNHGGGLRIIDSNALVISNTIHDNSAFLLGGGVWVQRGAPVLQGNQIMDNQTLGLGQEARGGGVQLEVSAASLISNTIANNRASGVSAYGGGVDIISGATISVTLGGNSIQLNATDSTTPQNGFGGGVAITGAKTGGILLTHNLVFSNTTSIDTGGNPENFGDGGGIFLGSGQVQLMENDLRGNTAGRGGGIALTCVNPGTPEEDCWNAAGGNNVYRQNSANQGGGIFIGSGIPMADDCCEFRDNGAQIQANRAMEGGGLYNDDQFAVLRGGLIFSNTAVTDGGGVLIGSTGNFTLTNSATIDNIAGQDGGAIYNAGLISVTNTTVSGNRANGMGGGFANFSTMDLANATVSDNTSADGAGLLNAGMVNTFNSLIAVNNGDNCLGVLNSLGHNLEDGGTCALGQPTDMSNTPADIDPLQDNGGFTPTHALAADSPAVDAGDNSTCPVQDQRGLPRPLDGDGDGLAICDIGAFEFQRPSTTTILSDLPDPSQVRQSFTVTFSVTAATGTPTGEVVVTVSSSSQSCTGMLVAGQGSCALTLSAPGTYILTATYTSDDSNYATSEATADHDVIGALYFPVIFQD